MKSVFSGFQGVIWIRFCKDISRELVLFLEIVTLEFLQDLSVKKKIKINHLFVLSGAALVKTRFSILES